MSAIVPRGLLGRGLLLSVSLIAACDREVAPSELVPIRVAAASDLTRAFEELGEAFERRTGRAVIFSFGASGLLATQIREGAPFDVFAAANVSFVDDVVAAGACDGASKRSYARGHLAVWSKRGGVTPATSLRELADPRFVRVAIANPEHAPYGRAAREALEHAGIWEALQPRLVLGENVRQTLQFAETGNVDAAVVALSLVVGDRENPWFSVDEGAHRPLDQALVVCTRGGNRAGGEELARFVGSSEARSVMRRYGLLTESAGSAADFVLPGEEAPEPPASNVAEPARLAP